MRFIVDTSKPSDAIDRRWTEVSYDGKTGSFRLTVPNHWHKYHDEYMEVLRGRVAMRLEGKETILTPESGRFHIPRMSVHGLEIVEGVETVFTERTDPPGDFKEKFFEDIFDTPTRVMTSSSAFRSFYDGDCYMALPGGFKLVDIVATNVLGYVASWLVPGTHKYAPGEKSAASVRS